jgi:excisionase family DNA binding protein
MASDHRRFLTIDQAVEARPYITKRHLRRLVAERRIPFYKFGGKLVFDLDELDELVDRSRQDAS